MDEFEIVDGRRCERTGCSIVIWDEEWEYAWCPKCCIPATCLHDNSPADCDECARESDRQFDINRERRMFGE